MQLGRYSRTHRRCSWGGRVDRSTLRLLAGIHELDLTSVGVAELERRVSHELAASAH